MGIKYPPKNQKLDGSIIRCSLLIIHLGGMLAQDGRVGAEVARRIGIAFVDLNLLERVWSHANISQTRKVQIFNACIVSKLAYSLEIE